MGAKVCCSGNSHPHALADAWLPSHNAALDGRVLMRLAGQAHVQNLLQQWCVELAHNKRAVGGDRPAETLRQEEMPVGALGDVATANGGHHLADVLLSSQRRDITQGMNCTMMKASRKHCVGGPVS